MGTAERTPVDPPDAAAWVRAKLPVSTASRDVTTLVDDLARTTGGGKRSRSSLFEVTYRALGGRDEQTCRRMGRCLEWLHEALVVHDDVADRDLVRRGEPNLSGLTVQRARAAEVPGEEAEHLGVVAGLLGGDLLLVAALGHAARVPAPPAVRERLLDEVERVLVVTIAGEYEDARRSASGDAPTLGESLAVAEAKTAEYSAVLPLVAAALLAGAPPEVTEVLRTAGLHLGTAYQIVDDVLGVFGDSRETGKSVDSDLLRRTPTVIRALGAEAGVVDRVDEVVDRDPEMARRLLSDCGARERALQLAGERVRAAREALSDPVVPQDVRDAVEPHLRTVVGRSR